MPPAPRVDGPVDDPPARLAELGDQLPELMVRDAARLRRRLESIRRGRGVPPRLLASLSDEVEAAQARVAARRLAVPAVTYPDTLPVSQRRDDIAAALCSSQVVVVAGETGSGKTTQLPKMCLELGRGVRGMIGHTQPRRIAARTVAERIAEELVVPLGGAVGYQVRFTEQASPDTLVKVMTDGILLAEIQNDRRLERYDTIILDEAHERSLNVDFLLGYLRSLLPRRPDLQLVITSATIDPQRFADHFRDRDGRPAPVVEVSGRTYPVEVRYRPLVPSTDPAEDAGDAEDAEPGDEAGEPRDQVQAIGDAVLELSREGPGDILVFLSGEREIRDTAEALSGRFEVLPLYARLSVAEQHRVFQPHAGRRVVLATNVAETSLTVPGIRYVVDTGQARISRYSARLKVQRLPIEAISQASADQRKGRCGRVAAGVCIRLYSEQDYLGRPRFTDPEILRTNLASVLLQMAALDLGDVAAFPFVDPPDRRQVRDGVALLEELGAFDAAASDSRHRLTPLGRRLAQLPVDPRLGRMVLEADRLGCVREVMVVAAALSIQDPRERPADSQQAADALHARFADRTSDFLTFLNLWNYLREQQKELSSNQFRRMCRREYLNYLRVREWQDIYAQLRQVVRSLGLTVNSAAADEQHITQALLSGLLSHIGLREGDRNDYLGARGARFGVFPGSALAKKPPQWVMAAELVETSRLWGRVCARIEPEWAETLAGHLVRRTYSEPHWEKKRAAVMAYERVTLYGVPLVASRKVLYSRVDAELCRELFLRHALVEGDWDTHHRFFHDNQALRAEIEELENRVRRRDLLVDDETLFAFYDERVPADVVSGRHFDAWWKQVRRAQPDLLTLTPELLMPQRDGVREEDYPSAWRQGELSFPLTYQFEPGSDADGVTVHVPLAVLNQVVPDGFDWQIPGLRLELVTALLRSLPKELRRSLVPAPDRAREVLPRLLPYDGTLTDALGGELRRMTGVLIPPGAWDWSRVPDHLRMTFRVEDDAGSTVAEGKDLEALQERLNARVRRRIARDATGIERTGLTSWSIGTLPSTFERSREGVTLQGYPALVDEGGDVAVRVLATADEQREATWAGVRRLVLLQVPSPSAHVSRALSNASKLALGHNPHGSIRALLEDCAGCAVDELMRRHGTLPTDPEGFAALVAFVRPRLAETTLGVVRHVETVLSAARDVRLRLDALALPSLQPAADDMRRQLHRLVHPGFVTETGAARLPDVARYLQAMQRRLDKLPESPGADRLRMDQVLAVQSEYEAELAALRPGRGVPERLAEVRWMIEELRVSLFAQTLRAAYPVSEKRVRRSLAAALEG